ncbi:MAG TPA: polyprenyl synthetase family protein [Myxococcales bacterium]|nr:polyprenyl synthetase family protein [Myxococcales bacterium]
MTSSGQKPHGSAGRLAAPPFLASYAALAEPRIAAFLDARAAEAARLPVDLRAAFSALREYALRGGKRLRGALVVLGCEAAGGDGASVLDASVGMELLHAYLLVHDDFMDRDEVRRGGPTVHAALERVTGSAHLGASLAVLLGSLCEAWALELVLGAKVPAERTAAAGQLLARALQDVTVGQMQDVSAPLGRDLSGDEVLAVQRLKTGGYSFELPLRLGALLAGANAQILEALEGFARPLGLAFQIADDLLGTFGSPEVTGKPNASDLREGKRTLLVARALEAAAPRDAALLRAGLGKPDLGEAEAAALREVLVRSGAAQSCREDAERLRAEATRALDGAALPAPVAQALRDIADYTVRRAA